jgi:tetratricopeptide (TPR) repeat protein/uncharacterized membrane protein YjgN (DUF898 family)
MPKGNCQFKGTGGQYFPTFFIHLFLISIVTFGVYIPWAWVRLLRLRASHTLLNGKAVSFTGTGGQLLGLAIVQGLLTMITLGFYGPWAICKYCAWRAQNTLVGGKASQFTGTGGSLFLFYLIHLFLLPAITLGIYLFWGIYRLYGWKEEHTRYGGETTSFGAGFGQFLKISLICWFLNLITFNLYIPWALCRLYRWQTEGLAVGNGPGVDHFPPVKTKPMVVLVMILVGLLPWVFLMLIVRQFMVDVVSPAGRSVVTGPPARLLPKAAAPRQGPQPRRSKETQPSSPKPQMPEKKNEGQKDPETARLDAMIQRDPRNAKALYNRAWIYAANGDLEQAEKEYTQAIKASPADADAYYNRGLVYVNLMKWDDAMQDFTEAIRLDPQAADAFCNRGNVHFKTGRADLAIKDYTDGLRIAPNDGLIYYNRGIVYLSSGEEAKGQEDLRRAAELGVVQAKGLMGGTPKAPGETAPLSEKTEGPGQEEESGMWRVDLTGAEIPEDSAEGMISGMPFAVDEADIQKGVLSLRQGSDVPAERELVISLSLKQGETAEGKTYTVSRAAGSGVPRVQMKWLDEETEAVKAETFTRGYAMRLEFGPLEEGRLSGKIYLCVPDAAKSYVAGVFSAEMK